MERDRLWSLTFNAITHALSEADSWLPLSARCTATDAAVAVIRSEQAEQATWEANSRQGTP